MNYEERIEIETKLGRSLTWEERGKIEIAEDMLIRKYANWHLWTDIEPYEVIRTISPICVEVRAMKTIQTEYPKDFHPGGFVGHYADNRSGQKYEYYSDPSAPVIRIRWSRARNAWYSASHQRFVMSDSPYKFYDYNF